MELASRTTPALIFPRLAGEDADGVLRTLADAVVAQGILHDAELLFTKLREREQLGSTGIGHGIAIPHCKLKGLAEVVLAIGLTPRGIAFGALDGQPVRLFFLVLSPERAAAAHLKCLAAISRWAQTPGNIDRMLALESPEAIYHELDRVVAR